MVNVARIRIISIKSMLMTIGIILLLVIISHMICSSLL